MNMKTKEEILNKAKDQYKISNPYPEEILPHICGAFVDGYTACQDEDRWISVEERLPDVKQEVLVVQDYSQYGRGRHMSLARVWFTEKEISYGGPNSVSGSGYLKGLYFSVPAILKPGIVTHWRPLLELPNPPKK